MKNRLSIYRCAWGEDICFMRLRRFQDYSGLLKRNQHEPQHPVRLLYYSEMQRLRSAMRGYQCIGHLCALSGMEESCIRDHRHRCEELFPAEAVLQHARFAVPCFTPLELVDVTVPVRYLRSRMRGDA